MGKIADAIQERNAADAETDLIKAKHRLLLAKRGFLDSRIELAYEIYEFMKPNDWARNSLLEWARKVK